MKNFLVRINLWDNLVSPDSQWFPLEGVESGQVLLSGNVLDISPDGWTETGLNLSLDKKTEGVLISENLLIKADPIHYLVQEVKRDQQVLG